MKAGARWPTRASFLAWRALQPSRPDSESHNGFAKFGHSSMKIEGAPATRQRSGRDAHPRLADLDGTSSPF